MSANTSSSSDPLRGIALSLGGVFLLTTSDGVLKLSMGALPFGEALFIRTLFVLIPIGIIVHLRGGLSCLRIVSPRNLAIRALFGTGSTFLIVVSLSFLPMGEVLTLVFVTPILVTALAPFLLGERVGWHRWLAVCAGFVGVIILLRPDAGVIQLAALLPLAAALVASLRDIVTRHLSSSESSLSILAFTVVGMLLASLATAPFGWRPVGLFDIATAGASGVLFGIAHFMMIESYRFAEASLVAPFRFTNLIWAPLLGFLLFAEIPDIGLVFGGPLIAASGLYIFWREREMQNAGRT